MPKFETALKKKSSDIFLSPSVFESKPKRQTVLNKNVRNVFGSFQKNLSNLLTHGLHEMTFL